MGLRVGGGGFQGISPFKGISATRGNLFFGMGEALEDFWRLFFYLFWSQGIGRD